MCDCQETRESRVTLMRYRSAAIMLAEAVFDAIYTDGGAIRPAARVLDALDRYIECAAYLDDLITAETKSAVRRPTWAEDGGNGSSV